MGYGVTTTALYGVSLSPEESQKLYDAIAQTVLRQGVNLKEWSIEEWLEEQELTMVAEDSDSRIHSTQFEATFPHCFGVQIAAKGYGGDMDAREFSAALRNDKTPFIARFQEVCQPLLDAAGVKAEPGQQIASCMD